MAITIFDKLSDLSDFIKNCKNFECYNCVGRQGSEKGDDKTTIITEMAVYSNVGILYHSSKNKFKTETTVSQVARKETILMDDKAELFNNLAQQLGMMKATVRINGKNNIEVGYLNKSLSTTTAEVIRTLS